MKNYRVRAVTKDCCWVGLPLSSIAEIQSGQNYTFPVFLRLRDVRFRSPLGLVCWSGDAAKSDCLEISTHLCPILELPDNDPVSIEVVREIPLAKRVTLKCVTAEDYELMNIEREFFESQILHQGALAVCNQLLPVWLRMQKRPIHLMPLEISPKAAFARMTNETELEILPPSNIEPSTKSTEKDPPRQTTSRRKWNINKGIAGCTSEITEAVSDEEPQSSEARPVLRSVIDRKQTAPQAGVSKSVPATNTPQRITDSHRPCEEPRKRIEGILRLQRPPDAALLDLTACVKLNTDWEKQLEFLKPDAAVSKPVSGTWFPSRLSISTPLSTAIFLHPAVAQDLGFTIGDFVSVSKVKGKESGSVGNTLVLRLFLSCAVSKGHCIMHDVVSSQIGVKYCQSVELKTAFPEMADLKSPSIITLHPISVQDAHPQHHISDKDSGTLTERRASQSEEEQSGTLFLHKLLTERLGLIEFVEIPQKEEKEDESQSGASLLGTAQMAIAYCSKLLSFASNTTSNDGGKEGKHKQNRADGAMALFLRALVMAWVEAQLEAAWKCRSQLNQSLSTSLKETTQHRHPQHFQRFCISPHCLMHFTISGESISPAAELILQLKFGDRRKDGYLTEPVGLRIALRHQKCGVSVAGVKSALLQEPEAIPQSIVTCRLPSWLEELADGCVHYLKPAIGESTCTMTASLGTAVGMLISGSKQSGKTSLVSAVAQIQARDLDVLSHVCYIPCRSVWSTLRESFNKFSKEKTRLFQEVAVAIEAAPSVVVFDDLDCLCIRNEESDNVNLTSKRAIMMIREIIEQTRSKRVPVAFLATCVDLKDVDEALCESGFFDHHIRMPDLSSDIRAEMLTHLFCQNKVDLQPDALADLSQWDAGFELADLERLTSRAMHCHFHGSSEEGASISKEDIHNALQDFKPAAQWRVSREEEYDSKSPRLEDVGGMEDVKATLYDCVELPIKFPQLMRKCPLRLMSNVLLYGPPGSGKTFVVNALKATLDIRIVSVKGPELLNKYVGQSEAAVRSTFKAASEAAPCILFFDEFEALGRHRGSDTSGISDRVVNQLLTEMDGVEGLNGVCVIAATSRPDLIDKALLRPGRLDRHVFCPLPSQSERLEILEILAKKQKLEAEIDLEEIAFATDGYSGADLTSIISEAHLHAVGELLKAGPDPTEASPSISITQDDIAFAMARSRPSSSDKEKRFLEDIYSNFASGKVCISRENDRFKEKGLTYA